MHAGAVLDLATALLLSELIGDSVTSKTAATYDCGVKSLEAYCSSVGLGSLPVDSITLCLWMTFRSTGASPLKPKSIQKYICGIRRHHLLHGHEWYLTNDPVVKLTITALRKKFPDADKAEKIILSLSTLLAMCATMPGWPRPDRLSYDNPEH
jgi:site-specific recombinase XerD